MSFASQTPHIMRMGCLTPGARLLWWELNYAWTSDDLKVCFPSQEALADSLGVSRSSIMRWLKELEWLGAVVKTREQRGNKYTLVDLTGPVTVSHDEELQ